MQLGSGELWFPPPPPPPPSPARGLGKFDFYCSKSHRPAYYLLTFLVEFKAVWEIFV